MLVSPLDYFMLFFSDKIVKEILDKTNRFSKEKIMQHMPLQKRSILANWADVTMEELKAFLGVLLNMRTNVNTDLKDYFSKDWLDRHPFFKGVFSRNRFFFQIFWMLHVNPPSKNSARTRADKMHNLVAYPDQRFRQ
jgi:hypothetical protein